MGFMAGFGPAFSRGLEAGVERRAQEKQDLFRFTMQDLINQRDKREEWKREDRKAAKKAESLLQMSGAPSEAIDTVYDWVKSGVDESTILKNLATGKFEIKEPVEGPQEAQEVDPVAQQMAATGLASEMPQPAPTAPEQASNLEGGLLSGLFGRKKKDPRQGAVSKAAGALGMPEDEANRLLTGVDVPEPIQRSGRATFIPGAPEREDDPFVDSMPQTELELSRAMESGDSKRIAEAKQRHDAALSAINVEAEAEARAKGIKIGGYPVVLTDGSPYAVKRVVQRNPDGTVRLDDGQIVPEQMTRPVQDDEIDLMLKINTNMKADLEELRNRSENHKSAMRAYANMTDIVEKTDGAVLQDVSAGFFQGVENWIAEAATFGSEISKIASTGGELPENGLTDLLRAEKELISAPQSLGTQKGLFEINRAILAYHLAASKGQAGRSLSEAERKVFQEIGSAGTSPDKFHQGMADVLLPATRDIDSMGEAIYSQNNDIKTFEKVYGGRPEQYVYSPLEKEFDTSSDPDIQKVWGIAKQFDRRTGRSVITPEMKAGEAITPPTSYPKPNAQAIELLRKNPSLRNRFEEMFGPGSADAVLGGN